jgi:NAD(P)-dependent dehydrogenase (short-subunit alcohol dehydrogenase family)
VSGRSVSRVALITGGGRGLGRVMALALLAEGHRVVLASTDRASLQAVAQESAAADRVAIIVAQLQMPGAAEQLAVDAIRPFGRIDMLFNNAGMGTPSIRSDLLQNPYRFWENDRKLIELFFAVNAVQAMVLAAKLAPAMMTRGWGRIICNTTSLDTMLKQSLYGGSKAALEAETAVMARDLAGTGVTANVLVPGGGAGTRMTDVLGIPRSGLMHGNVMAAPAVFLASDASNGFTARRILANRWNAGLAPAEAAAAASDPIAWTGVGAQGVQPAMTQNMQ